MLSLLLLQPALTVRDNEFCKIECCASYVLPARAWTHVFFALEHIVEIIEGLGGCLQCFASFLRDWLAAREGSLNIAIHLVDKLIEFSVGGALGHNRRSNCILRSSH